MLEWLFGRPRSATQPKASLSPEIEAQLGQLLTALSRQLGEDQDVAALALSCSVELLRSARSLRVLAGDICGAANNAAALMLLEADVDNPVPKLLPLVGSLLGRLAEEQSLLAELDGTHEHPVLDMKALDEVRSETERVLRSTITNWPHLQGLGPAGQASVLEQQSGALLLFDTLLASSLGHADQAAVFYASGRLCQALPIHRGFLWAAPVIAERALALAGDTRLEATYGDLLGQIFKG